MLIICVLIGEYDAFIGNMFAIVFGDFAASAVFGIEMFELDIEEGCLELVEAGVESLVFVLVFYLAAVVGEAADHGGELVVVGGHGTGIAEGTEVFTGVEAEAGGITQRSCLSSVPLGTNGLGVVFDDLKIMFLRKFFQSFAPAYLSVEVDEEDGAGFWCY